MHKLHIHMKSTRSKQTKQKIVWMGTNSFSNYLALRAKRHKHYIKRQSKNEQASWLTESKLSAVHERQWYYSSKKKIKNNNNTEQVFEVATLIYYKAMKMNVSKKDIRFFFFSKEKKKKTVPFTMNSGHLFIWRILLTLVFSKTMKRENRRQ